MLMVYDNKKGSHDSIRVTHDVCFRRISGYSSNLEEAYNDFKRKVDDYMKVVQKSYEELGLDEYAIINSDGDIIDYYIDEEEE